MQKFKEGWNKKEKVVNWIIETNTSNIQPCASRRSPTQATKKGNSSSVVDSPHISPIEQVGGLVDILVLDNHELIIVGGLGTQVEGYSDALTQMQACL